MSKTLLAKQNKKGAAAGSWDPVDAWGEAGGRVYSTAAGVLSLSSSYRLGATEPLAMIPNAPPFQKVHELWKRGAFGAAATALAQLPADVTTAEAALTKARIGWYVAVEVEHQARLLATLD
ncbi:MAG: hypothetical protein ABIP94_23745, partial [Planctomycetota bacterium]